MFHRARGLCLEKLRQRCRQPGEFTISSGRGRKIAGRPFGERGLGVTEPVGLRLSPGAEGHEQADGLAPAFESEASEGVHCGASGW